MSNMDVLPREKPWPRAKSNTTRRKIKGIGCYECSRRRIDCDRTVPQCKKCLDKNYQCSGIGVRYRFSTDLLMRDKAALTKSSRCSKSTFSSTSSSYKTYKSSGKDTIDQIEENDQAQRTQCVNSSFADDVPISVQSNDLTRFTLPELSPNLSQIASIPDHLDGATRYLLDYFANTIAPILAVIDRGFNGYRDLFLPISEYDSLVRKAIIIASEEHISLRSGGDLPLGRQAYNEVFSGLRTRAQTIVPYQDDISLIVLLLLLLCEMISGRNGFSQIYGILRSLFRNAGTKLQFSKSNLGHYLRAQVFRVRLIGESLFDEAEGSNFVQVQLQNCLAFLRYCQDLHPEFAELMSLLFDLMTQASHIYVQRAICDPPPWTTIHLVERFIQTAESVSKYDDTVGHHLLLWPYFVVGAESHDQQHRDYFVSKLAAMHRKTNCKNASKAILQLKNIWKPGATTRWTSLLGGPEQIFIM